MSVLDEILDMGRKAQELPGVDMRRLSVLLGESRRVILEECSRQGWPDKPVDSETWCLLQDIERACSSSHNLAVRDFVQGT